MRILLIAYEFPPSPSPQSLRWAYLCRELHRCGHDIDVLTIDLGGDAAGLPDIPAGIAVHRTWPGPVRGLIAWRRRRRQRNAASVGGVPDAQASAPSRSGWKHRVSVLLQRLGEHIWFPDLRGEWHSHALAKLDELLARKPPDVVISSHEPATTLELGLHARHAGFKWVADIADPVLAPYTLPRWKDRAHRLEADTCRLADAVLVTTPAARSLLQQRHTVGGPIMVLTQGFDDAAPAAPVRAERSDADTLELLYTGSFYSFRTAGALLQAVIDTPRVRLNIATIHAPDDVLDAARDHPGSIRLLGFLPHLQALAWQRSADVLVNLANRDPSQVPGKCYEYMGACRPILHLGIDPGDAVAAEVLSRQRGWVCAPERGAIAARLQDLQRRHVEGRLAEGLALDRDGVAAFGWGHLAQRLDALLRDIDGGTATER